MDVCQVNRTVYSNFICLARRSPGTGPEEGLAPNLGTVAGSGTVVTRDS